MIELNKDTGAELAAARYDMHDDGKPAQLGTTLAARLSVIPVGRLVLIGVYDSGFNSSTNEWNEAAYNAMEKLGAQKIRRLDFRDSYALVTVSGSPHNTIELHKKYVQRTSTSAECGIGTRIRPQATVQYRYNANGQRIYKQVSSNPAEHYVLDEDRILGVFKGAGLLYWNIYGNGGVAGRLEYILPEEGAGGGGEAAGSTQKLFYLKDHLGSTRAVMNTNGAVVESYDYYPFGLKMPGRIYPATPTVTKNLFTGKELDGETGWYHLGSRPLMSALGRLSSPDRFADKYPSLSPYQYAANNPMFFVDLTGDTLDLAGDVDRALQFVHSLVDEDIRSRITVDENGRVSFNTEGLDLTNDIGLQLANALINSEQKYLAAVRNTYQGVNRTTGALLTLEIPSSGIANLSITPRNYGTSLSGEGLAPIPGYQGQIVFGIGEWQYSSTDTRIQPISNIAFHELMENFNRTVNQMPYYYDATKTTGAHPYAIDRARLFKFQVGPAGKGYFIPKP